MDSLVVIVVVAVCVAFALGAAGGWTLRGVRAAKEHHALRGQARDNHARIAAASAQAAERAAQAEQELVEMAAAYRELHEYQEGLLKQLEAARLHIRGLEDEVAVQQRSAQVAREELGVARRRVGQLEGELRGMKRLAGRAANDRFDEAPTDPGAAAWKA